MKLGSISFNSCSSCVHKNNHHTQKDNVDCFVGSVTAHRIFPREGTEHAMNVGDILSKYALTANSKARTRTCIGLSVTSRGIVIKFKKKILHSDTFHATYHMVDDDSLACRQRQTKQDWNWPVDVHKRKKRAATNRFLWEE